MVRETKKRMQRDELNGRPLSFVCVKSLRATGEGKHCIQTASPTGYNIGMVTSSTSQHQLLIMVSMESLCRYLQPASSQA